MVLGVLGGFAGVILIARRKSPGRKLAKTHASLQNRPEVALASFGVGKSPLSALPDRHLRIRQSSLADSQASLRTPRACRCCARLLTKENVVDVVRMCGYWSGCPVELPGFACCIASASSARAVRKPAGFRFANPPAAQQTSPSSARNPAHGKGQAMPKPHIPLDELRVQVESCRRCPLCDGRTQTVFGVGNPHARVMFIGEAPGKNEEPAGRAVRRRRRALPQRAARVCRFAP